MLFHLFYSVLARYDALGFLRVFRYTSTRILAAAITALVISFLLGPWFIERLKAAQVGQQIRDDGPQTHQKKAGTPTMGGSLVLLALVLPTILWCDLRNRMVWLALAVTVGFGAVGFVDDYLKVSRRNTKGLSGKVKLAWELAIAGTAIAYLFLSDTIDPTVRTRLALPFTDFYRTHTELPVWLYVGFATIVVVGAANAVNLTDGLDGLAIGATFIAAATYAVLTYVAGNAIAAGYLTVEYVPGVGEVTIFCGALVGASLGFLWYNAHPAEIFMGDVGSLALGGAIATVAILIKQELLLVIVGGIFVIEAASVVIQVVSFKLRGKRVFKMAPLHHHFELSGWEEPKIITRFLIVAIIFALFSLTTLKLR